MVIDPRTITPEQIGTRLRDAAVDPRSGDFLPPSNAGKTGEIGNPHGPTVVSPELHGSESVTTIRPGAVADDAVIQSAELLGNLAVGQPQISGVTALAVTGADTVVEGATIALVATASKVTGSPAVVTSTAVWLTDDPDVATVAAGVVTGVAAGVAKISASYGGKTAPELTVTVTAA